MGIAQLAIEPPPHALKKISFLIFFQPQYSCHISSFFLMHKIHRKGPEGGLELGYTPNVHSGQILIILEYLDRVPTSLEASGLVGW